MNDRAQMQFFGRQNRKAITNTKARLCTKHPNRTDPSTIITGFPFFQYQL